jgi:hypothetical protein
MAKDGPAGPDNVEAPGCGCQPSFKAKFCPAARLRQHGTSSNDRFTGLDRMLIAEQQGREFTDLRPDRDMRDTARQNRASLIERAHKLERMGLATEVETGKWIVSPKAEPVPRGSLANAATSSRPCTGRWSRKGWRRTAIPRST